MNTNTCQWREWRMLRGAEEACWAHNRTLDDTSCIMHNEGTVQSNPKVVGSKITAARQFCFNILMLQFPPVLFSTRNDRLIHEEVSHQWALRAFVLTNLEVVTGEDKVQTLWWKINVDAIADQLHIIASFDVEEEPLATVNVDELDDDVVHVDFK